jgi:hypothetical protein
MTSENKLDSVKIISRNMRNRDDELVEHLNGHARKSAMVRYDIKDHE